MCVRLASGDPHVQPILDYRYLTDAGDRARMRQALRQCIEITEQPALQTLLEERLNPTDADLESDATLDAWLLANVQTQHHSSGTCKMGPASDPMAVVDQHCRVHGLEGIRVVDASVMPDVVPSQYPRHHADDRGEGRRLDEQLMRSMRPEGMRPVDVRKVL